LHRRGGARRFIPLASDVIAADVPAAGSKSFHAATDCTRIPNLKQEPGHSRRRAAESHCDSAALRKVDHFGACARGLVGGLPQVRRVFPIFSVLVGLAVTRPALTHAASLNDISREADRLKLPLP
jgi:hypothetical protein